MNYHELTPQDNERIERWKETLECSEDEMLAKLLDAYCSTPFLYSFSCRCKI